MIRTEKSAEDGKWCCFLGWVLLLPKILGIAIAACFVLAFIAAVALVFVAFWVVWAVVICTIAAVAVVAMFIIMAIEWIVSQIKNSHI